MAVALVPALIVAILFLAALIALGLTLPGIAEWLTPFAAGWDPFWAAALRAVVAVALLAGAVMLAVTTFTAVTLLIGEPLYDRVWRSVEREQVGAIPESRYSFWSAAGDAGSLVLRGVGIAILSAVMGFIPVAGTIAAAVTGTLLTGWALADELTQRALTARGLTAAQRRQLLTRSRARVLGFGVATQLCFLVPGGAIAVMPAAVAGSTLLSHDLLARDASVGPQRPSA